MSELIQIRQRIKTIETTHKITHAMRLIAMSSRTQLRQELATLSYYTQTVLNIFSRTVLKAPQWSWHTHHQATRSLCMVIGSQKGLCGPFNTNISTKLTDYIHKNNIAADNADFIAIGKKALDILSLADITPHTAYPDFNRKTKNFIAQELTQLIATTRDQYKEIFLLNNTPVNFFLHRTEFHHIVPPEPVTLSSTTHDDESLNYQSPAELLDSIALQLMEAKCLLYLTESLLAEDDARFISMDNATRNAETLLESSHILCNKLRQAIITKELIELSGNFNT